jgi:methionyl-tRNA synthetase
MDKKKYCITTAIAYTSGKPHIGNTYEIVLADAIARYKRLTGYDVYFQTGTDEHGQKIEDKAHAAGMEPQAYVDKIALEVRNIWDVMNTSYDKFARTTNPEHMAEVQKIFKKFYDQGDIYKGEYEGMYCKECEAFYTPSQLVDGRCPECHSEVKPAKEEAYFFKMNKYAPRLIQYIEDHPEFIQPESRKNEMINNFLKPGLQDLCVSRTSFDWGIPVDFDSKHVIYVWIDALFNYLTFMGYHVDGNSEQTYKDFWPADLQLVGKDIMRFHTTYWPIMLMALDLPLPKQIFGHPWILMGTDKMSKSRGNIMYADDLVKEFGVDAIRYYVLHEIPFADDGTITYDLIIDRTNGDLANILGNLVQRTISMSFKYFDGKVLSPSKLEPIDQELIDGVLEINDKVEKDMDELRIADALTDIFEIFRKSNKYIDDTTPWTLAKDPNNKERLATVLYNLLESIRHGAVLLQAFLPDTANEIFRQLNTENKCYDTLKDFKGMDNEITLNEPKALFARIDKEKKLAELEGQK